MSPHHVQVAATGAWHTPSGPFVTPAGPERDRPAGQDPPMTTTSVPDAGAPHSTDSHSTHPVTVPDDGWEAIGAPDAPGGVTAVLLTTITINGVPFHATAIQVVDQLSDNVGYAQVGVQSDTYLDHLAVVTDPDGPWMTMTIAGRPYVVYLAPYCS